MNQNSEPAEWFVQSPTEKYSVFKTPKKNKKACIVV